MPLKLCTYPTTSWWTSAGLQKSGSKSLKRSAGKTVRLKKPCSGLQGQPWDLTRRLSSLTNTGLRQIKSSNLYVADIDQIVCDFALTMEAVDHQRPQAKSHRNTTRSYRPGIG